jgi:hypothetical protein
VPLEESSTPDAADPGPLRRGGRARGSVVLAAVTLTMLAAGPLAAVQPAPAASGAAGSGPEPEAEDGWFPGRTSFAPLLAAPREVTLRGGFLAADRGEAAGDFRGTNLEADVALGHRLPVVRLQSAGDARPELTLGLEVGVFTRFFMETPQRDLIGADFRVGAPLSARWNGWRARLTLLHVSAHLGDDFVQRFDPPARQMTRDGFELLVARAVGDGVRLYGGGEWNFHVNEGVERAAVRAGVEWDPGPGDRGGGSPGASAGGGASPADGADGGRGSGIRAWPFAAGDARATTLDEGVAGSAVGGLALRVEGVVLRLEARVHVGPTALGELRGRDETAAGVGLRVKP